MKAAIANLKPKNIPYFFSDQAECREFIQNNFSEDVVQAYDGLIPRAYKADLWRYCVLYKHGGIYIDVKYTLVNPSFNLTNLIEKEHWVLDADGYGVYNAVMVVKPKNPMLEIAIRTIVENVKNKYRGSSDLEPTGPHLLGKLFTQEEKLNFDMKHYTRGNDKFVSLNGVDVLRMYDDYYVEQRNQDSGDQYSRIWEDNRVYRMS